MPERGRLRCAVLATTFALVLGTAACTGSGGSSTTGTQPVATTNVLTVPTGTEPTTSVAPAAGAALKLFVEAAGQRDANAMWPLLSSETQDRLGGDSGTFADRFAKDFEAGIGSFAGTDYRVVLAVRTVPGWAVAAIVGSRTVDGKTQSAAYAVALRDEGGFWRLEIGGPVTLTPVVPSAGVEAGTKPQLGMRVEAGAPITVAAVWINGSPLPALAAGPDATTLLVAGKPVSPLTAGTNVGIGFARAGGQASARAWPIQAG